MRVHLRAVGRIASGTPERLLTDDYFKRFAQAARPLGWRFGREQEVEDKRGGGPVAEAALLGRALPRGGLVICLDERGEVWDSPGLANRLRGWADSGRSDVSFVIGGADGLDPAFVTASDGALSLGRLVWPHKLARVMVAEQLYRAATIVAGGPYHRA